MRRRSAPRRRAVAAALAAALAAGAAGCGFGAGERTTSGAAVTVTRDFGSQEIGSVRVAKAAQDETVMRLLQRRFDVKTRYGGGFVQSIGGVAGGQRGGRPYDWFYFVNGILAEEGAAATTVSLGDRVWWDNHDWGVTMTTPAVVGSFPEPFTSGLGGKRYPTRLDCASAGEIEPACDAVQRNLSQAGIVAARSGLGAATGRETLRVVVGLWPQLRGLAAAELLERGPRRSGVYAVPAADGRTIAVLDPTGRPAERLGAGAGLVAATRNGEDAPTWIITGTDLAGLRQAAEGLTEDVLRNSFAVAFAPGGITVPAPEVSG